jgi:hypothetical protein
MVNGSLQMVVCFYLYKKHKNKAEQPLTQDPIEAEVQQLLRFRTSGTITLKSLK